jgi:membrane protein DedA with SNARE-associated domain
MVLLFAIFAAILRGVLAETFGQAFEPWLEAHMAPMPHYICVIVALVVAVVIVETIYTSFNHRE